MLQLLLLVVMMRMRKRMMRVFKFVIVKVMIEKLLLVLTGCLGEMRGSGGCWRQRRRRRKS